MRTMRLISVGAELDLWGRGGVLHWGRPMGGAWNNNLHTYAYNFCPVPGPKWQFAHLYPIYPI